MHLHIMQTFDVRMIKIMQIYLEMCAGICTLTGDGLTTGEIATRLGMLNKSIHYTLQNS